MSRVAQGVTEFGCILSVKSKEDKMMTTCNACLELSTKGKEVKPHPSLVLRTSVNLGRISMGQAKGLVNHYVCSDCGTQISCDTDKHDKFAGWWISKPE
jgi:hypothetical protein